MLQKKTNFSFNLLYILFVWYCINGNPYPVISANSTSSSNEEQYQLIKKGIVDNSLLSLLKLCGIAHNGTLQSIDKALQTYCNTSSSKKKINSSEQIQCLNLLKKIGFFHEIKSNNPIKSDYVLLFSSTKRQMEYQLVDFITRYQRGQLTCKILVLLGATQPLQPNTLQEMTQELKEKGKSLQRFIERAGYQKKESLTMIDLWRFIWDQKVPRAVKKKFIANINLLLIQDDNIIQKLNVPSSIHTLLLAWDEVVSPQKGYLHANIPQPYAMATKQALWSFLNKKQFPNNFHITWHSPKADDTVSMSIYLQQVAMAFHTAYINFVKR